MDPIADMLTRIRNSAMAGHEKMICPSSKVKKGIVSILEREGFTKIFDYSGGYMDWARNQ